MPKSDATVKLWKRHEQTGDLLLKELRPSMFRSWDDYHAAVEWAYACGFDEVPPDWQPAQPSQVQGE